MNCSAVFTRCFGFGSLLVFIMVLSLSGPVAGREKIDGIAAVIGDEVVLLSELDAYIAMRDKAAGALTADSSNRRAYLDELIDGKVLLAHAKLDSEIVIKNDDVEQSLNSYIGQMLKQYNLTPETLDQELKKSQGMSLVRFKVQVRKSLREKMVKDRVFQKNMGLLTISRRDVESFYNEYKDSLPKAPQSVRLSCLAITVQPSDSARQAAFRRISQLKTRLNNGEDFAALAKQFSEDPSAANGGDIGFIDKGSLSDLAFEEQAFSLKVGDISEPFESRFGFHIITVIAKKDQQVNLRQIMIPVIPDEKQIVRTLALLDSVRSVCTTAVAFEQAVDRLGTDKQLASQHGRMGWQMVANLGEPLRALVDSLKPGAVCAPLRQGNVLTLYRLDEKNENRTLTLTDDWDILAEKAREIYTQKKMIQLVKQWRQDLYISIRL